MPRARDGRFAQRWQQYQRTVPFDPDIVYVYVLLEPIIYLVRYVGITGNPADRRSAHYSSNNGTPVSFWVKTLRDAGLYPVMNIVDICKTEDAARVERKYIERFFLNGLPLLNVAQTRNVPGWCFDSNDAAWEPLSGALHGP